MRDTLNVPTKPPEKQVYDKDFRKLRYLLEGEDGLMKDNTTRRP